MEIFISALIGELVSRFMSSIISKCSKPPVQAMAADLERILRRGQVIVDEATRRRVTNQAMLRQLNELRDAMFQGYHVLDTFRCREEDEDALFFFSSKTSTRDLAEVLHGLRSMIQEDISETAMLLTTYPPCLYRQPYSMHLLLDKCMFGRQMEMQQVIDFLLRADLSVLPVVGPARSGKSTLVAHVCGDERVRRHFSQILFFSHGSFRGEEDVAVALRNSNNGGRLLVVIDNIVGDKIDDDLYNKLCSLCQRSSTTKIIITGQSDKIKKVGRKTTRALTLSHLSHEAYWYFFKVITFGSTDPENHPELLRLAMAIARTLNRNLIGANIMACLLRDNFSVDFWRKMLDFRTRYVRNHIAEFGEHPFELITKNRATYIQPIGAQEQLTLVLYQHHICSSQEESKLPKLRFQDVVSGSVKPEIEGPFRVLKWRSRIPPYRCYICTCEVQKRHGRAAKKRKLHQS